jgi:flagellar biogenesis protein FliO
MNMKPAFSALAACLILFSARAVPARTPAVPAPAAERSESMAEATLPPPPTPAMEEKFRKLQKEMERKDKADPPRAGASAGVTGDKAPENTPPESIGMGGLAMQILFGLAFVLLLAVVSIRGLKRLQGRMLSRPGKGGDILEVLESCHLGSNQRIVALRMNDEVGVIGVTQHGISLLTVLKEPMEELRRARMGAGEGNSAAFSDNLNKLLERFKKPKKVSDLLDEGRA